MKIRCNTKTFLKGLNSVNKAVPSRTTQKILTCVLIQVSESMITLTANNLELAIRTQVDGIVEEPGETAMDAKLLFEMVHKLPQNKDLVLMVDENQQAVITCGKASYRISCMDAQEFPAIPEVKKEQGFACSQFALKEMIRQTIFSVAANDTNKMMTGELLQISDQVMSLTSLEGHRISIRKTKLDDSASDKKIIIPGTTMNELMKLLDDGTVNIYIGKNLVLFEFNGITVVSRLIEGNYFNVDQMITSDYSTKVILNKDDFMNAIECTLPLIDATSRVPVIETITDDGLELKIRSQIGNMNDELEAVKEGDDLKIGFNPNYLLDVLHAIDDDSITMYFGGAKSPCFIRDEYDSYIYVVLPVNFVD